MAILYSLSLFIQKIWVVLCKNCQLPNRRDHHQRGGGDVLDSKGASGEHQHGQGGRRGTNKGRLHDQSLLDSGREREGIEDTFQVQPATPTNATERVENFHSPGCSIWQGVGGGDDEEQVQVGRSWIATGFSLFSGKGSKKKIGWVRVKSTKLFNENTNGFKRSNEGILFFHKMFFPIFHFQNCKSTGWEGGVCCLGQSLLFFGHLP